MAELRIDPKSEKALQQRLESPEGRKPLDDFVGLIAHWAVEIMTPEMRECFSTPEGMQELRRLWPEIMEGYFRHLCGPTSAKRGKQPSAKSRGKLPGTPTKREVDAENARLIDSHSATLERYRKAWGTPELVAAADELCESLRRLQAFAHVHSSKHNGCP